jgi:hypothetical protein
MTSPSALDSGRATPSSTSIEAKYLPSGFSLDSYGLDFPVDISMNLGFDSAQITREFNLTWTKDFDILRVVNRLFPLAFFECGIHFPKGRCEASAVSAK